MGVPASILFAFLCQLGILSRLGYSSDSLTPGEPLCFLLGPKPSLLVQGCVSPEGGMEVVTMWESGLS